MPDEDQKLKLAYNYDAPVEKVWEAWSNPDIFAQWYGFPGKLEDVTMDFQEGGQWKAVTVLDDGRRFPQIGKYTVIEEGKHLRYNFLDPNDPENQDYEIMDVMFESYDGKTKMSFIQTGHLPPEEYATGLKKGWSGFFDKLGETVNSS